MHEAPRQGERVVAAFDFDKTISTRDNVVPFLRAVVGRTRLTQALLAISPRLIGAALDDERRDTAKVALVRRTVAGYDAGRPRGGRVRR
jgi:phosphatidylglycerophosphatase C